MIAGCDGSHGVCLPAIPERARTEYAREYPFGWLGILARVAPSTEELIYARHERGFALHSMRSPELSRFYLQCEPDADAGDWPDERIWDELRTRLALDLGEGPIVEKGVTPMRSFVVEPMRHGRLFLAGDAAHIVPPTGAKGLNLAVADVRVLAAALGDFYATGDEQGLRAYSETCAAPRLARRALLVVDDLDAAPLPGRRGLRGEAPALAARVRGRLARRRDHAGRELRRHAMVSQKV